MTAERFKRYLFDGGFSFGEEYVPPKWSISDENTKGSPFGFLEFDDEHKDLCDEIVDSLNEFVDEYNHLKKENEQLKSDKEHLMGCLIRFFGYDDEDIDYNLNRESNREYGKAYYFMKEETKKEFEK